MEVTEVVDEDVMDRGKEIHSITQHSSSHTEHVQNTWLREDDNLQAFQLRSDISEGVILYELHGSVL